MNIWVEYWEYKDTRNNTHAQMREQAKWTAPNPKDIKKRFFPNYHLQKEYNLHPMLGLF